MLSRRAVLAALPAAAAVPPADFDFVHFTDPHIQPTLGAAEGCRDCFRKIQSLRPDFVVAGGDLVFDANETTTTEAHQLFRLYGDTARLIEVPLYTVLGNHDVLGLSAKSRIPASDPQYGKKYFTDHLGPRFRSFDHKGWHFILLDSIGTLPDGGFHGHVDDEQLSWLAADLERTGTSRPIIVITHVPLVSAVLQLVPDPWKTPATYLVTNAQTVLQLLKPYRVVAVLQGHTHIRETVLHHDTQFITSGAVSGNWWKGPREGHPEGFGHFRVRGGKLSWTYVTYGFRAR